jgi:hypothetical protein
VATHRSPAVRPHDPTPPGLTGDAQPAAPFPVLLGELLAPDLALRVGRAGVLRIVRWGQDLPLLDVDRPAAARYTVGCPRTGEVAADLRLPGADPSAAAVIVAAVVLTRLAPQVLDRPGSGTAGTADLG